MLASISPISSRKMVPPSACSNRPTRRSLAPVNAPFSWPKSSLSRSCGLSAAQWTATKRPLRSAEVVQRVGDEFLARAALALDEHGRARRGDLADRVEHVLHRRRRADEGVQALAGAAFDLLAQFGVLALDHAAAQGAAHEDFQPVEVQRLGDEIVRPALHRGDGGVHRAVGGHHDAHRRRGHLQRPVDERHAVLAAQAQVGQEQIDALALQDRERAGHVAGRVDLQFAHRPPASGASPRGCSSRHRR